MTKTHGRRDGVDDGTPITPDDLPDGFGQVTCDGCGINVITNKPDVVDRCPDCRVDE